MRTDPRALRLFLAVCRAQSISGAARAESLSQPSVSVSMAQLERSLGAKLFERHRSGIRLTAAGQALRRRAEAMENLIAMARTEVHLTGANLAGPLFVGGTPGALATLVPKTVAALSQEFPRFELHVLEQPDEALHELLRNYSIDLAVATAGLAERPEDIREMTVGWDTLALIVGPGNREVADEVSLKALTQARWVLPEAVGAFRQHVDALFVAARTPIPRNTIRCDSLLTTKAIVAGTAYITILPQQVVAAEIATGTLRAVRIREAAVRRQVGVLWLAEREPAPLARAFLDQARRLTEL